MLEVGKVYTFKFNSGEEMLAKYNCEVVGDFISVTNPLSVAPSQQGMSLIPSLFTADPAHSVTININSISMYTEADETIKNKYLEVTTGIKVPEKKIILG